MIGLLLTIGLCVTYATIIQKRTDTGTDIRRPIRTDLISLTLFFATLIAFCLFSGLRSSYNDTYVYRQTFIDLDPTKFCFPMVFEAYGGFELFQVIIKRYISDNPQFLILFSSVFINVLYVRYIFRYSKNLSASVFLYAIGIFVFSMGGIKQAMAMAIAIYAISAFLEKKYYKAIVLLLIAFMFHPYIICLVSIVLLTKTVWSFRTIALMAVSVFLFINLDSFFSLISVFGKDYSQDSFAGYTINPMRVAVESIPIIISLIYKERINESKDTWLILGTNMSIISFSFIFLGLFFEPVYLGRLSTYFSIISMITIPRMLNLIFSEKTEKIITPIYYTVFFVYFVLDMTKLGTFDFFADYFKHVSLFSLF